MRNAVRRRTASRRKATNSETISSRPITRGSRREDRQVMFTPMLTRRSARRRSCARTTCASASRFTSTTIRTLSSLSSRTSETPSTAFSLTSAPMAATRSFLLTP